ncbi:TonB-dependent receptor [Pararobbsia alpina]|nr:TonB-dependent receptor [Pararobbsia alpina]
MTLRTRKYFARAHAHRSLLPLSLAQLFLLPASANAEDSDSSHTLPTVTVVEAPAAGRPPLDPDLPASVESVTRAQFENWNVASTEDTLKYMPGLAVRKRFTGDLNSIIAVRGTSSSQSARGLVYADGLLISNFLNNTFSTAPRWSLVFPNEIERVDVIYGPYSALYPGNSIGATVDITTRMPERFETDAQIKGFTQHFDLFGVDGHYNGGEASASVGDRIGKFSFLVGAHHLSNTSQPLTFATLAQSTTPAKPTDTVVSGAHFYNDQNNKPTAVLGINGEGIERTLQDQLKLKLQYDFTPTLTGGFTLGYWHQTYDSETSTSLRDVNGNPVYSGELSIDGQHYTVPAAAFAPSRGYSENWLYGLSLRTHRESGWNAEAIASNFDVSQSVARTAASGMPENGSGSEPGQIRFGDGTGWKTLDLKATYTPAERRAGFGAGAHTLSFGYHYDNYFVDDRTYKTWSWSDGDPTSLANAFKGSTRTQALFAQDAWRFLPRWQLVYGMRYEDWRAYGGARSVADSTVAYPEAAAQHFSPKASLSFDATQDLTLRASVGKAYRYPTVGELFQGQINGSSIVFNNPNLKAEEAQSKELTAEWAHWNGLFRVSLFQDDVRNTLFRQTDITVIPNITNVQNIDRVRSRGIETSYQGEDVGIRGLDLLANIAFTQSKILENSRNPETVGKHFYRIPLWRANLATTYRVNERWAGTLGVRFSGRQYNTLTNTDTNPDVYGGTSNYTVAEVKLTYRPNKHSKVGIGIDNLFDTRYFVYHPYPGRTLYVEASLAI